MDQIKNAWRTPLNASNSTHVITAKNKLLHRILNIWSKNILNLARLIANCNMTVAFFDKLEEIRPLYPHELKFINIIKEHIRTLLSMQNQYWKQRFTQRVMMFVDENTKFFHSMATKRFKKNVISQIMDDTRRMIHDHAEKSALFGRSLNGDLALLWIFGCNSTSRTLFISTTILSISASHYK
jgi:hypothetical protein